MSVKIVHTFGRHAGDVQSFDKDIVRLGRAPDNDVIFDPNYDRDASTHHAEIKREGGAWAIVDLNSKNGTWIKGVRVTKQALAGGEEIAFGPKGPRVRVDIVSRADELQPEAPTPELPRRQQAPLPHAAAPFVAAMPQPQMAQPPIAHAPQFVAPARPAQPQQPPIQPAPVAGSKRVGQRTIAWMINAAVSAAGGRRQAPSAQELSAYVDRQVNQATAGQQRTTYTLAFLLVVALAALTGLVVWSTRSSDEIESLREQLANLSPNDPKRKEIESKLGTLHPSNASFGRNLYDTTKKGIFMLAAGNEGFCTAFAVRPNVLATNAHCVVFAQRHSGIVAIENESRGQVRYSVTQTRAHPLYRAEDANAITPDVGVVTIDGRATTVLDLASSSDLQKIGAGDDIYLIGFPGRLMDPANPAATFLFSHVGRTTNAQGHPGAFGDTWLVQHDAPTTHGTSGSPIFNGKGKVIAINSGGYLEGDDVTIAGRKTAVVRDSPYKFGMRIDLLDAILK